MGIAMKVNKSHSVDFAIRTLSPTERGKVSAWIDHLANWKNDQHVRNSSKPSVYENVYVLTTSDDLNITFSLDADKDEITVLDLNKPSRFKAAALASE